MKNISFTRVSWIDICRGIGILSVLYGHVLGSDKNRFLVYAFHMPLFFFLSGIVFNEKGKRFISTVIKNAKTILLPYFTFALLTYILGLILMPPDKLLIKDVTKQLTGILYGSANQGYLAFNTALWFLPCLFVTKVSFALLSRIMNDTKVMIAVLVIVAVVAYLISIYYHDIKLPFEAEIALTGIVFFGAGYLWNKNEKLKDFMQKRKRILIFVAGTLLVLFSTSNFVLYGSQIDMRVNRLNDFYLFYLAAFSGIFFTILLSMIIQKNTLLEYIGKYSILLLGWHTLIFTYFKHISFFLPIDLNFLTPTVYLTFATIIILLTRLFFIKTLTVLSYQRNQAKTKVV